MKLKQQREWYEQWYEQGAHQLPVERLKHRMRLEAIDHVLSTIEYNHPLVIGCGYGDELRLLNTRQAAAFDLSHEAATSAKRLLPQYSYCQADAMNLPYPTASFDVVLSSEVFEHILNPQDMLAEVRRVLRPGGYVLLTTPNWRSFFGLARWGAERVLRRPVTSDDQPVDNWSTPQSLKQALTSAGFKVVSSYGAWYFPPTGLGMKRLPDAPMASVFKALLPLEKAAAQHLPGWGHMLVMLAQKSET